MVNNGDAATRHYVDELLIKISHLESALEELQLQLGKSEKTAENYLHDANAQRQYANQQQTIADRLKVRLICASEQIQEAQSIIRSVINANCGCSCVCDQAKQFFEKWKTLSAITT